MLVWAPSATACGVTGCDMVQEAAIVLLSLLPLSSSFQQPTCTLANAGLSFPIVYQFWDDVRVRGADLQVPAPHARQHWAARWLLHLKRHVQPAHRGLLVLLVAALRRLGVSWVHAVMVRHPRYGALHNSLALCLPLVIAPCASVDRSTLC